MINCTKLIMNLITVKSVAFIALALSDDGKMGGDSAIECVNEQGVIKPYASLTFVNGSYGAVRENVVCAA